MNDYHDRVLHLLLEHLHLEVKEKECGHCDGSGRDMNDPATFRHWVPCPECGGNRKFLTLEHVKPEFECVDEVEVKGRGLIKTVVWPEGVDPERASGRDIIIDGEIYYCRGIESLGHIKAGRRVGLVVTRKRES